jgi:hypothetical protein
MGEKIVVGPFNRGLRNDVTAFNIDNDSFPTIINAYQWRGRLKRKRGTAKLNRLKRYFDSTSVSYSSTATITLNGSGVGNLLTGFSLQANGNIVPGSVTLTASGGPTVYTDPTQDGYLTPTGTGGPNTINYATGVITIPAQAGNTVSATFNYYPDLPVMGIEDFFRSTSAFLDCIAFDTTYAYNVLTSFPYDTYSISFYKNPPADPTNLPGYIPKTNVTQISWNGQDYQQFWTVNYQGAFWATNGINIPFATTNIGMQYKFITNITIVAVGPPAIATLTIVNHGLVVGDFLFINEVPLAVVTGINFQTGYVIAVVDANNVTVEFPNATLGGAGGATASGIAQYLTNRSDVTIDCIRWYDGDPTDGNVNTPILNGHKGWVNFMPPLSQDNFSIADLPAAQYYLAGARMIVPFKDRLLFFGPVVQTSAANSQVYLSDTVIYSQNGTPYYTASYTNTPNPALDTPTVSTTVFNPILVPTNQTATSTAYFEDATGFGGNISAGTTEEIRTVSSNEDVLIVGFEKSQTRLVYSGNDIVPFNFFLINSEYGSTSTFSSINLDKGVITRGSRGFVITSQTNCARIDLEIPDEVFQISALQNGTERLCSQRDFINEWIYFTYPFAERNSVDAFKFPNQTLQYNYRDTSWAINFESYTTYGLFRRQSGFTWQTVGNEFPTWSDWNQPWNAGTSDLFQPEVAAGNQQGFIVLRDQGTGETESLYIQSFSGSTVTSPAHGLNQGDFIIISDALGSVGSEVNGKTFRIDIQDNDTFVLNPPISGGLTYFGEGLITRLYVPYIQSKQFPVAWEMARKTRLGVQQYLLSTTQASQITLLIFLSQNGSSPYNDGFIVPTVNSVNNSLIYSAVLYTCPESTNLGLTPANINLQMVTAEQQSQIWHRINTSLLGDTVQVGFTLSDLQMSEYTDIGNSFTITGATQANPCVLTCANTLSAGDLIRISGVVGMTQLNFDPNQYNYYHVLDADATTITIEVDSTGFDAYVSGGTVQRVSNVNQTAEVEIHGFILDVSASSLLA